MDQRAPLQPLARASASPAGSWRRGDEPPVDGLDVVGRPRAQSRASPDSAARAARARSRSPASRASRSIWAARVSAVADREDQAALAVPDDLLVELEVGDDAGSPRPPARRAPPAAPAGPRRRRGTRCRRRPAPRPARSRRAAAARRRSRSLRLDARQRIGGPVEPDHRLPVEVVGQAPQRPQEEPQRAPLLLGAVDDPDAPSGRRVERRLGAVRARADQLVGAGEEALDQLAGRLAARGPGVDAPEEHLDQHPRHLGREHPLGRLVEGRDVQRERVAQRSRSGARREGLVDVDDVEVDPLEQLLERAADVHRDRRRPAPRPARERDAAGRPRAAAGSPRRRASPGRPSAARIARRDSRIAVRESDGAAIRTRCPRSASCPEVRATNWSISWRDPQGCGLTWATWSAPARVTP